MESSDDFSIPVCMRCFQSPCICVQQMRRAMERERMNHIAKSFLRDAREQGMVDSLIIALVERGLLVPIIAEAVSYGMAIGREDLTREIQEVTASPEPLADPVRSRFGTIGLDDVEQHAREMPAEKRTAALEFVKLLGDTPIPSLEEDPQISGQPEESRFQLLEV